MFVDEIACTHLKGVGKRISVFLEKLRIYTLQDLLFHLPSHYQDQTRITPIAKLSPHQLAVIEGQIVDVHTKTLPRKSLIVRLEDETRCLSLRFFHFYPIQLRQLQPGVYLRCYGEVRFSKQGFEMIHPEYQIIPQFSETPTISDRLTPIYPTTAGLSQSMFYKMMQQIFQMIYNKEILVRDYLPDDLMIEHHLMRLWEAIQYVHQPSVDASLSLLQAKQHPAQQRLIIEELLTHHLGFLKSRQKIRQLNAPAMKASDRLVADLVNRLPFSLTDAQQRVLCEIQQDLKNERPMLRLIQGDVGCGKTIVAIITALQVVENGYQVAMMAPTEILAEQHFNQFQQWFEPLKIKLALLKGSLKEREKKIIVGQIADGSLQMIVGTHALFQKNVEFRNLGLVIIDEQHRFGVYQRLALCNKGVDGEYHPHQLTMTATPIPRSLAMVFYGDLDVSIIDQLPAHRLPITTLLISHHRRFELIKRVEHHCRKGYQIYWVCTLIEESDVLQCQAAENTFTELVAAMPQVRIGLVHGRMKAIEKELTMRAFKQREIDLLVATTVIEVGVDVPNATLMVIENPERLGLAQLHQLRGRVGRGEIASHCVLLYQSPLSLETRNRLTLLRDSQDGFFIAQKDLELRGPGEILGLRQSGMIPFRIADLTRDQSLIPLVQKIAQQLQNDYSAVIEPLTSRWLGEKAFVEFV